MSEIICKRCGTHNRTTAKFCSVCGEPFLTGMAAEPPQPEPVGLPPETVLQNRYQIEKTLGRGGFGAVYRAFDLNLNRPCAVKENLVVTADSQRQFFREASALANLSHPNLPRVTDYFAIPNQGQYLVMDFIDGNDLDDKFPTGEAAPVAEGLKWIIQVAEALEYMHNQSPKVLHRDIKPANIRVTPTGKAVLVDFGLVKMYHTGQLKTTVGARAITPGYAPPEQYGTGVTDVRTDVYALGATAYRLLTGIEPVESVQRLAGKTLELAHKVNPHISFALSQAIEKAVTLDPDNRYASMADFISALRFVEKTLSQPVVQPVITPSQVKSGVASTVVVSQPVASHPAVGPVKETMVVDETVPPASRPVSKPTSSTGKGGANKSLLYVGVGVLVLVCVLGVILAGYGYNYYKNQTEEAHDIDTQTALERTELALEESLARQTAEWEAKLTADAEKPTDLPPSATPPASTATATMEATVTLTEEPFTATPVNRLGNPDASQSGEVFFETEFEDADNWSLLTVPSTASGNYSSFVQGGKYNLGIKPEGVTLYAFYDLVLNTADVYVETYAQKVAGPNTNNLSVLCRGSDAGWYEFSITSGGLWYIWRYKDKLYTVLANGGTKVINMVGQPNTVAASCVGSTLTLFVNGQQVGQASDRSFMGGGKVGVSIFAEFPGLGVEFEYFKALVP